MLGKILHRLFPCDCKARLKDEAVKAYAKAVAAERSGDHEAKRSQRIIGKSCVLAVNVLEGKDAFSDQAERD